MTTVRSLLAASVLSLFLAPALPAAAADEPADAEAQSELKAQLKAARERLEEAAREVARLSGELTGPIVRDRLMAQGFGAPRAMLGIGMKPDGGADGVAVDSVTPEGPAGKAGVAAGDLIVAVDGKSLKDATPSPVGALRRHMNDVEPGDTVKLELMRGGKKQTVEVVAGTFDRWGPFAERFEHWMPRGSYAPGEGMFGRFLGPPALDMELVTLTPGLGRYFGADSGVLVVRPPEEGLKLQEGDVIVDIGGRRPESAVHAMRILRSYQPGESMSLNVLRDRKKIEVTAQMPATDRGSRKQIPKQPRREQST